MRPYLCRTFRHSDTDADEMGPMEDAQLLQSLEIVADELAVEVRREDLDGSRGGLCRLRGRTCILVDRNLSLAERVDLMARSLARLPLDGVFMPPAVRELLEQRSASPA